jgi:ribosome-interacting GTPase 1
LILIVLDAMKPLTHKKIIERELEGFGIRLNKRPPDILIKRKDKGGVSIMKTQNLEMTKLSDDTIRSICHEYKISNADLHFRCNATADDLIDVIEGNRVYTPCIYVINKIDSITIEELELLDKVPHYVPISAKDEWNFDELMEKIWEYLDLIRIYTKPKGQIPDYEAPVIVPRRFSTVEGFCNRLHKALVKEMKYAMVWGTSVKHNPQKVGKDH